MFQAAVYQNFALGCTMLFIKGVSQVHNSYTGKISFSQLWILVLASSLGKIKVLRESLMMKRIHFFNVSDAGEDNFIIRCQNILYQSNEEKD